MALLHLISDQNLGRRFAMQLSNFIHRFVEQQFRHAIESNQSAWRAQWAVCGDVYTVRRTELQQIRLHTEWIAFDLHYGWHEAGRDDSLQLWYIEIRHADIPCQSIIVQFSHFHPGVDKIHIGKLDGFVVVAREDLIGLFGEGARRMYQEQIDIVQL